MIHVNSLSKKYKDKAVLDIDSLTIPSGEIFGLVGNNGAGKTTFFSLLLDLIKASTGHILNNQVRVDQSEDWKPFTSAFIDESFLISYLTPEEYFYFIGELRGLNQQDVDLFLKKFEDFFHGEILQGKKYLRDLSKGNQKKVGIIASFIGEPKVIILDEPFANLDPSTQIRLKKIIGTYRDNPAVTMLISSHDLAHVTEVCQRIVVLNKGHIVKDIRTSEDTLKDLEGFFSQEILNEAQLD
ncbi:ABC transporter ATP-binding protein [Galbibacter sp.]|uniref:ABC transporter ATP-binding protein n=1 Tax=Galbibacter sp. TaxID=2918471 RepID=UPI002D048EC3|nr:ABC transporter ATP-binding protein [Galbibacter sp.]HLV63032.1 ABC transporter ATP-binding protein [Galbibacter sp.]